MSYRGCTTFLPCTRCNSISPVVEDISLKHSVFRDRFLVMTCFCFTSDYSFWNGARRDLSPSRRRPQRHRPKRIILISTLNEAISSLIRLTSISLFRATMHSRCQVVIYAVTKPTNQNILILVLVSLLCHHVLSSLTYPAA